MCCAVFILRYSAKTLECLSCLPADGQSDICYNVIASLIQHIILHKPVSKLVSLLSLRSYYEAAHLGPYPYDFDFCLSSMSLFQQFLQITFGRCQKVNFHDLMWQLLLLS